ncbi:unnamed protein product, partial [Rotaria sp. Silwood1]
VKIDPNDISMHLKRIEHIEKHGTRKHYLNSLQSLLMALHPSENSEQKSLYLEKYRILIQTKKNLFLDIERLLQMQYNSKLYPELLKNLINFTGVHLSKFNTELELPIDTTDLDDLKEADDYKNNDAKQDIKSNIYN